MWENNRHVGMGLTANTLFDVDYKQYCRMIPDFPKKDIKFWDITPLLLNGDIFNKVIDKLSWPFVDKVDAVVCIEARGFLVGSAVAYFLGCGLIPVRKQGKLPRKTIIWNSIKEYGADQLELHEDDIKPNQRYLIVDDVLATGGTAQAVVNMVKYLEGNVVGCAFLGEIEELNGRTKLDVPIHSVIKF